MTENDFNQICDSVLIKLDKKTEYADLCNRYWAFEKRKGLSKKEANEIKHKLGLDFELAGTERMFYKDYFFRNIHLRFMLPYGHGMIDCSYRVFSPMSDNSIPSFSYRQIVHEVTGDSDEYERTFPINTDMKEYEEILSFILEMNKQLVQLFEQEILKLN